MTKKKCRAWAVVGALSVVVIFAAVVFAATGTKYSADTLNTITTSGVHIRLNETTLVDAATQKPVVIDPTSGAAADSSVATETAAFSTSDGVSGVLPGQAYAKNVSVTNTGSQSAWVRVKVEKEYWKSGSKVTAVSVPTETRDYDAANDKWNVTSCMSSVALDAAKIDLLGLNTADWTFSSGYYYYNAQLAAGATTSSLFTGVQMSGAMGTEYSGLEARVNVTAQATQVKNNGTDVMAAMGWPD